MNQDISTHLIELRKRIIYIIIVFLLIFGVCFHYSNQLYDFIATPLLKYLPKGTQLVASDITSPFFAPLKLAGLIAFIIVLPHTIYQIWKFIAPAMYKHEKSWLITIIFVTCSLFATGIIFCYFIVLPVIFTFISNIKATNIIMLTDIQKYLDFVISMFLIFGIAFQLPIIVHLLIKFKIVTKTKLKQIRKYIFVGVFIVAAIVTPPDILSQTLLALPLYCLYEIGVFFSKSPNEDILE